MGESRLGQDPGVLEMYLVPSRLMIMDKLPRMKQLLPEANYGRLRTTQAGDPTPGHRVMSSQGKNGLSCFWASALPDSVRVLAGGDQALQGG